MKLTNRQPNLQAKVKHRITPLSNAQRVRMFIRSPQRLLDELTALLGIFIVVTIVCSILIALGGLL